MKEMSTIKFPNHSDAYEIVDAAARASITSLVGTKSVQTQIKEALEALQNLEEVRF